MFASLDRFKAERHIRTASNEDLHIVADAPCLRSESLAALGALKPPDHSAQLIMHCCYRCFPLMSLCTFDN